MIAVLQLDLFDREPAAQVPAPRRRLVSRVAAFVRCVQMDLLSPAWLSRAEDEPVDDDPFCASPVIHRVVHASRARPPQTSGIRSVFDMASSARALQLVQVHHLNSGDEEASRLRYSRTIREAGVTRHIAMRYDETEEWAERERARRARQKVPRPSKAIRTRSRKLLEMVGQGGDA